MTDLTALRAQQEGGQGGGEPQGQSTTPVSGIGVQQELRAQVEAAQQQYALSKLLAQVEAATGADRELDAEIARWLGWTRHTDEADPVFVGKVSTWWAEPGRDWSTCSSPPHWSASLDAVLALVEEKSYCAGFNAAEVLLDAIASMRARGWRPDQPISAQLAPYVISALLAVLIAQGESEG